MKLLKKLFVMCVILAVFGIPSSAEDIVIDTSFIAYGRANLIVNVDGEISNALSDTFVPGNTASVTAPDVAGKTFNYWTNAEGKIISYNKELSLTIYSDTGLNAVYGAATVTAVPVAEFLSITKSASQILFNVIATVPSGNTITEYGIRYSTTKNTLEALKGTDGVTAEKAGNSDTNWRFFVPNGDDTACYAVAYVVSGGQTYYSNVITAKLSDLSSGLSFRAGAVYLPLGEEFDIEKTPDLRAALKETVFDITFDANNGTGTMSPQGVIKNIETKLNANKFTRNDYDFTGWNTEADGTGTSYQDNASVTLSSSMNLYAQWKFTGATTPETTPGETTPGTITVPVLTCTTPTITIRKGVTLAALTVKSDVSVQKWLTDGELPKNLSFNTDENKLVISGTVSREIEAGAYDYTVRASNEAGTSEPVAITITVSGTSTDSEVIQISVEEISNMTDEEITRMFIGKTNIELTGNITNLSELIKRLERLMNVKILNLSQIMGAVELKLENTKLEGITLEGNQSIKNIEITGNLLTLNLKNSKVETVDVKGCKNLEIINIEGAENLQKLNVRETKITTLNAKDCTKLETVEAKSCKNLKDVNFEGCESLEYLDVSETAITQLDVAKHSKLGTLYCDSSDIEKLNIEGCENLKNLNCSNNSLLMLNVSGFTNLISFDCHNQRAEKPLASLMNFADLLSDRDSSKMYTTDEIPENPEEITSYLTKIKNLQAFNEAGNEISLTFNQESGEVTFSSTPNTLKYDYDTGYGNVLMDVEITASGENSYDALGASGSGCSSNFRISEIGILSALMLLFIPTLKKKYTD